MYRRRRTVALTVLAAVLALVVWGLDAAFSGSPARTVAARTTTDTGGTRPVDAARFAPGACQELAPTRGDTHTTVFVDAGHGGLDPGGVGHTQSGAEVDEAHTTLPVELDAAGLLRAAGFTVVVSRTGDTTVARIPDSEIINGSLDLQASHDDVAARDRCANEAGAALLVGIYFDAGASSTAAGSVTGYDTARSFSADNQRFATLLQHDVIGAMNAKGWGVPDEGAIPDSGLGSVAPTTGSSGLASAAASYNHLLELGPAQPGFFTTPSRMPGAVIEPLFLTDPFEGSLAASATGQRTIAGGLAQAVEQYFAPAPAPGSTTTTGSSPTAG
jgi:N-acetylmuramoyl-L-alanine amidase